MLLLKPQHLSNLPITQRRLPLPHLPRNLHIRTILLQKFHRRHSRRNSIISSIENLKPHPILLDRQIADLAQVASVDVGPGVPLAGLRLADVFGEVTFVFVRFDDVADAEGVDVGVVAAGEGAGCAFAAEFAESVGVHGVVVVIFFKWERVVVCVAFGETDAVGCFGACDDDLPDAEFACRLDYVVG